VSGALKKFGCIRAPGETIWPLTPLHLGRVTAGRGEVDVLIARVSVRELPLDRFFQVDGAGVQTPDLVARFLRAVLP